MNRRAFIQTVSGAVAASALPVIPNVVGAAPGDKRSKAPLAPKRAPRFGDGRDWRFEKRFGMFVHWGLYAIHGWHEPTYPNEGRHHELPPQPGDRPNWENYLEFLQGQVRELSTNYGEIHGFWWDMNVPKHVDRSINDMIRRLQPKAVINDRGFDEGDFGTPERDYTKEGGIALSFDKRTEACQSVGMESWGYRRDEDYYSDRHLMRSIDRYLARDANYLLNVGPTGEGLIPPESAAILQRIGKWYHAVKESLEGAVPASHLTDNRNVLLTRKGNTLYVHLYADPVGEAVKLKPLAALPRRATLLNTGQPVECSLDMVPSEHVEQGRYLRLRKLPVNELANTVLVAKLEFDREPDAVPGAAGSPGAGDLRVR